MSALDDSVQYIHSGQHPEASLIPYPGRLPVPRVLLLPKRVQYSNLELKCRALENLEMEQPQFDLVMVMPTNRTTEAEWLF